MTRYWKYAIVAVVAFLTGSATIVSAGVVKQFAITNQDGTQTVGVSQAGELLVTGNVAVDNLPDVQPVQVNNFADFPPVQVTVGDTIDPLAIVNISAFRLSRSDPVPGPAFLPPVGSLFCLPESTFEVPQGKALLLTEGRFMNIPQSSTGAVAGPVALATDARGVIYLFGVDESVIFTTPLVVNSEETVCPFRISGSADPADIFVFLSGVLVDAS